jgi:hypothetical protein
MKDIEASGLGMSKQDFLSMKIENQIAYLQMLETRKLNKSVNDLCVCFNPVIEELSFIGNTIRNLSEN